MIHLESIVASAIILFVVVFGGYFGWKQWKNLRRLRVPAGLDADERRYQIRQSARRLATCVLMVALGAMIAGSYLTGLNNRASTLRQAEEDAANDAEATAARAAQRRYLNFLSIYWICALIMIFAMMCLALFDLLEIRRFGLRRLSQMRTEQHEAIIKEAANWRKRQEEQNGEQNGSQ
ncbi:MAG: hypothetical protein KatS3mg105_4105 [Gemmatales bacterium]|nr:MAG: hypothetical protein KatS3mg105_4105 [Gemmatales bacterium]